MVQSPGLEDQQQVMSAQSDAAPQTFNATMNVQTLQRVHMEIPTEVLQSFQQASALDQTLLSDLRVAVQELHNRLQYRTSALGSAVETLHGGYDKVFDELQRVSAAVDAQTRTLTTIIQQRGSLEEQLNAVKSDLKARIEPVERAQSSVRLWQAEVEAHIQKIETDLHAMQKRQQQQDERHGCGRKI